MGILFHLLMLWASFFLNLFTAINRIYGVFFELTIIYDLILDHEWWKKYIIYAIV